MENKETNYKRSTSHGTMSRGEGAEMSEKQAGLKTYPIFSGGRSEKMWKAINGARTIQDLSNTLYIICCNLQELETRIESKRRAK